jgi:hypothetical protein
MNLNGIGQASSYANSAYSNNLVSLTETYKRLIGADRILDTAAFVQEPRARFVDMLLVRASPYRPAVTSSPHTEA